MWKQVLSVTLKRQEIVSAWTFENMFSLWACCTLLSWAREAAPLGQKQRNHVHLWQDKQLECMLHLCHKQKIQQLTAKNQEQQQPRRGNFMGSCGVPSEEGESTCQAVIPICHCLGRSAQHMCQPSYDASTGLLFVQEVDS